MWELEQTTPRHGDRPWEMVHLDHTELDIELVSARTGRSLGRPWATFMTDAFSRRLLVVYLAFDPPSYRSCMMALRQSRLALWTVSPNPGGGWRSRLPQHVFRGEAFVLLLHESDQTLGQTSLRIGH